MSLKESRIYGTGYVLDEDGRARDAELHESILDLEKPDASRVNDVLACLAAGMEEAEIRDLFDATDADIVAAREEISKTKIINDRRRRAGREEGHAHVAHVIPCRPPVSPRTSLVKARSSSRGYGSGRKPFASVG